MAAGVCQCYAEVSCLSKNPHHPGQPSSRALAECKRNPTPIAAASLFCSHPPDRFFQIHLCLSDSLVDLPAGAHRNHFLAQKQSGSSLLGEQPGKATPQRLRNPSGGVIIAFMALRARGQSARVPDLPPQPASEAIAECLASSLGGQPWEIAVAPAGVDELTWKYRLKDEIQL